MFGSRSHGQPDPAALFRRCRAALGLSAARMAAALFVGNLRTVQHWEGGDRAIPGPVWLALSYLLRDAGKEAVAREVEALLQAGRAAR
jgi:hypothetical protein